MWQRLCEMFFGKPGVSVPLEPPAASDPEPVILPFRRPESRPYDPYTNPDEPAGPRLYDANALDGYAPQVYQPDPVEDEAYRRAGETRGPVVCGDGAGI